ncbi:MAG TPA: DCC1-like thiol-disulfide oxidoreductase family protein [Candidatus Limnocylindrales bacterium]|jgi:predicted DCC family thiol-disulfide oxidoreductase YuxK|nr:DCC1-like thiol-disulfide oxidoreductase family protein [Candidatus Limnocylindrales bacterium]
MRTLYVLYDPQCELCSRLKDWLLVQRSWLGLSMVPAGSEKAEKMFPGLKDLAGCNDLVVISDEGDVYLNNAAWIMALYALEDYRDWACRLAHPLVMPFVRQAFEIVSRNRYAISRWLKSGPEDMACDLSKVPLAACDVPAARITDYLE